MSTEINDLARMKAAGLSSYREVRGTLWYLEGLNERVLEGWFRLSDDERDISARKVGGRNRWQLTSVHNALTFRKHDKGEQA